MLSNDAKIRACFPTSLAATAPRSKAVSSTLKVVGVSNRRVKLITLYHMKALNDSKPVLEVP